MMNILEIFRSPKKTSATAAKERLLQLIVDERKMSAVNIRLLQEKLLEVIADFLPINEKEVVVEVERANNLISVNVVLPES